MLSNYNNYRSYNNFLYQAQNNEQFSVNTNSINRDTWYSEHFLPVLNIFRDGIETDVVQNQFIRIDFNNTGLFIYLSLADYLINLMFWRGIVELTEIKTFHIYFHGDNTDKKPVMTKNYIKEYIDFNIIEPLREERNIMKVNNIIADTLSVFKVIDEFSLYLCNTICLEDDIKLMKAYPEARALYNPDLSNVPIEEINTVTMQLTRRLIDLIIESGFHCAKDYFVCGEGIKDKQYKEYAIAKGLCPNGEGGIYPEWISTSYINGGLQNDLDVFMERSSGRIAQILSKNNVGDSGHFARLLGLNNSGEFLHNDPSYACNTKNLEIVTIKSQTMLNKYKMRWYRFQHNGQEFIINPKIDKHLIGKTILVRSPITCSSRAHGNGICYKCYGRLAYTNSKYINIGRIASQILSAILTQILLSAKHLLEAKVIRIDWSEFFLDVFVIDTNIISVSKEYSKQFKYLQIDLNNIDSENEEDDSEYNDYVIEFNLVDTYGNTFPMKAIGEESKMYLTDDFINIVNKYSRKNPQEDLVNIDIESLVDVGIFAIEIYNNELSKTMDKLKYTIDRAKEVDASDRHSILQNFLDIVCESGLNIDAVHCEVIIANQIRSTEDIMDTPNWDIPGIDYKILTLKSALSSHPNLSTVLSFQYLSRILKSPLLFRRTKSSKMDLFFNEMPQNFMNEIQNKREELKRV